MPDLAAARVALAIVTLALAAPAGAHAQAGVSYQIPPDNPFASTAGARGEVFVYGMRNPYRWSFDRQTGDMYIGDVGGVQEEITFLPASSIAGADLGWNCRSGTADVPATSCDPPADVAPAYSYPSSGDVVIGGYVVRDPGLPSFAGQYLYAQFDSGLYRLGPGASGTPVLAEGDPSAVSGLGEDSAGRLYAVSLSGPLYRLAEQSGALQAQASGSFDEPVAVAPLPGDPDRIFIVEKPGRVMLRSGGGSTEFLDITGLVGDDGGEEGLLAFAAAPDYPTSGRVFAFYTTNGGDLQLDEFARTATGPDRSDSSTRRPILTIPHQQAANHNGGQLLFGPDGMLYLSTGDGGTQNDPEGDARDLGSLLGKILRIDVRVTGSAPPPPPAADTTAPGLSVRVKRRQRVLRLRGVVVRARCTEACSVSARGRLRIRRRSFRMRPAAGSAQARARTRLKLRLTRRGRRALRKAVRRGRRPLVRITLRAADSAGNRSAPLRRTVRVRR